MNKGPVWHLIKNKIHPLFPNVGMRRKVMQTLFFLNLALWLVVFGACLSFDFCADLCIRLCRKHYMCESVGGAKQGKAVCGEKNNNFLMSVWFFWLAKNQRIYSLWNTYSHTHTHNIFSRLLGCCWEQHTHTIHTFCLPILARTCMFLYWGNDVFIL